MDGKQIRTINALNGDQFNVQPGRVNGIFLYFSGTNDATLTATLADLGSVVVTRDSRQIVNATVEALALMNDIRFGSNLFSSVTGGAFTATAFIPFFESDYNDLAFMNSLFIEDESELNFEWVPASTAGTVFGGAGNLELSVWAELAPYREKYEYRLLRDNQTEGGAVASKPYQINKDNVTALFLRDPSSVVDLIQLEQNGRSIYSPQPWNVLLGRTLRLNKLEVTTFGMIELQAYARGNPGSAANVDTILSVTTTGAGTIEVLTTSLHWWDEPA